ncbi:hypothetical protein C7974DRAFT_454683 [Boeremia exigua]|uniref:uncharacterized protein n=1 Tax=Boeremia exigua TaxID=749465 RepID=UPI001E8EF0B3|nr:uncharacterized protein C7974DRAFT_454683 [Boeremia exigua]KAH6629761.1 hypothetical protein C7974DRAFT_454683 [Boeremia exigua]
MANVATPRKDTTRCDESRPSCQKCIHAGWTCDGYAIPLHKPKVGSIGAALTIVAMSTTHVKNYAIPFKIPGSQQDRRVLHYFCVQGCADISGYFNTQFWDKEILQWCHREPVVRQALVALSSLHLNQTTAIPSDRQVIDGEVIGKYGKALRALGRRIEQSDFEAMTTALICCVLFYCVEAGLNNAEAAMRHLEHGLTILNSNPARQLENFSTVGRVLNGLDLQATLFDDARTPRVDLAYALGLEDVNTGNAAAFPHLDEAHHGLLVIENLLFRFLTVNMPYKSSISCQLPASVQTEKIQLMQYLHIWRQKFDRFWTNICLDADIIPQTLSYSGKSPTGKLVRSWICPKVYWRGASL